MISCGGFRTGDIAAVRYRPLTFVDRGGPQLPVGAFMACLKERFRTSLGTTTAHIIDMDNVGISIHIKLLPLLGSLDRVLRVEDVVEFLKL